MTEELDYRERGREARERNATCLYCKKSFFTALKHQKYCNPECCRSENAKYRMRRPVPLSTSTVGAISELRVSVDLLEKGYEVFRALSPSCSCDLAILKDGELKRIEVKTGYRLRSGEISRRAPRTGNRHDILAICLSDEIIYNPPL